jgi:RNA recognition motif-containing protein
VLLALVLALPVLPVLALWVRSMTRPSFRVGSSGSKNGHLMMKQDSLTDDMEESLSSKQHITKLFVGNLPTSTTLPELLDVFKKYGPVNEKLSVVKDQNYAFIHFFNRKDAELALSEVNDSLFKDRYIRVQFSTSQGFTTKSKGKKVILFIL